MTDPAVRPRTAAATDAMRERGDLAETFRQHQRQRTARGRAEERLLRELTERLPEMDRRTLAEFHDLIAAESERRKPGPPSPKG